MAAKSQPWYLRVVPSAIRGDKTFVPLVRLNGAIGMGTPLRPALTLSSLNDTLERAFAMRKAPAVVLAVNSPGGSPVQSALIHSRIRQLAREREKPVIAYCEDVAASGGYWLASAGDEIFADPSSIIGSIGVLYAGFGFPGLMEKLGVERRVYTAGEHKMTLDPFQPAREQDVERLKRLQADVHDSFKALVRERRAGKLNGSEEDLFSGAFWSGRQALALGLVDGIGSLHDIVREKFGPDAELKPIARPTSWIRRLGMPRVWWRRSEPLAYGLADELVSVLETRALWQRFGL